MTEEEKVIYQKRLEEEKVFFEEERKKLEEERKRKEEENLKKLEQQFNEMKQTNEKQIQQLEEWTELQCSNLLFNSEIDEWNHLTSVLNERIIGKKQLVFLIEDEDGEKFGYYLNTEIIEEYGEWIETDDKSFHFNLQSNGRLPKPMKFEIKDSKHGRYCLYGKSNDNLINSLLFK